MKIVLFSSVVILFACMALVVSGCRQAGAQASESGDSENAKAEWQTFKSTNGKMTVDFPVKPDVINRKQPSAIGDLDMEILNCKASSTTAYTVNVTSFPVDPSDYNAEAGMNGALEGQRKNNEVLSETDISGNGMIARELLVKTKDGGGLFLKARCYVDPAGPTMYQINVVGKTKAEVESNDATRFLDSINIAK